MRSFLLVIGILFIVSTVFILGIIIYQALTKCYKYKFKNLFKLLVLSIASCVIVGVIDFSIEEYENKNKVVQFENTINTSNKSDVKNNKYIELLKDNKSFSELNDEKKELFFDLVTNWNSQDEDFKEKFKQRKQLLEEQKDDYFKKQHDESREKYAILIDSINKDFKDMKVDYISEVKKESNKKVLNINMNLLENIDLTKKRCAELTVKKETEMKNAGITNIDIYIKNNEKDSGLIFFELRDGTYHPTFVQIK